MNMLELERLTRENDKKNNRLITQTTSIDCLKSNPATTQTTSRPRPSSSAGRNCSCKRRGRR